MKSSRVGKLVTEVQQAASDAAALVQDGAKSAVGLREAHWSNTA